MKKRLLVILSLVLATLSILGACVKTPSGGNETMDGDDTMGDAVESVGNLLINGVSASEYTLIYSSKVGTGSTYARNYFNSTLKEKYEIELEYSKTAVDGYNIFIGVLGSDETVNAFHSSCEGGMIGTDGKNVYLLAKDNSMLYTVIDAFFAKTANDAITVSANEEIAVKGDAIKVMSYNVLYDPYHDDNKQFPRDITALAEFIKDEAPDVFGTQETQSFHKEAILEAMPNYECYEGIKLKGGAGMMNMIFWNADKFKMIDYGFQYLTSTPFMESKIPESNSYRGLSYVVFESLETQNQFLFVDTHLTYRNSEDKTNDDTPRYKQAQYLNKFLESKKYVSMPTILVGDFNSVPDSDTIKLIEGVKRIDRAAKVAEKTGDLFGTINGTQGTERQKYVFDHIFVTSDRITTKYYTTLNTESKKAYTNPDGTVTERYLSDHMPVVAEIVIY